MSNRKRSVEPPRVIKTVGDLRQLMDSADMSPEQLAENVPISNMTIRRLLRDRDSRPLPMKYVAAIQSSFLASSALPDLDLNDSDSVTKYLRKLSKEADSETVEDQLRKKMKSQRFDKVFLAHVASLKEHLLRPRNKEVFFIAAGALLYFISPFDLVPDYLGPIGYVDDFFVMSVALTKIAELTKS